MKGAVIQNKEPETIIKALHEEWCLSMSVGFPTVGFWSDNGGEFMNRRMEEFMNKLGLRISFTPSYSPWTNSKLHL